MEMSEIPTEVFRHGLATEMTKHVRPPTKKDLGKKVRELKPIPTTRSVADELLSTANGLPAEDEQSGLVRLTPGGPVKPKKSTANRDLIKIKLQDQDHIDAVYSLQHKTPTRGLGAARLVLPKGKEKKGFKAKQLAMAAAPWRARITIPKGKAALKRMPMIKLSHNVVMLDENGTVTFGVTTYPPWMKQKLRAKVYSRFLEMGQKGLPVDPTLYETARERLADPSFCGQHAVENSPPLPPPPPTPSPSSRKRQRPSPPKTTKPAKKSKPAKYTEETYLVRRIFKEVQDKKKKGNKGRMWYAVEWDHDGYEASWEAWRSPDLGGAPGTPVVRCSLASNASHGCTSNPPASTPRRP